MIDDFRLNIDLIPKELKLILKIIRIEDIDNSLAELTEGIHDIDWKLFMDLSMHHRLYPLLFRKLKKIEVGLIPSYVIQSLGIAYKRNTFQMLHLSGEMEQVCRTFNEKQIRLLVLKGPVLAADLYGDLSLRTCGDLDVLVNIKELEKVDELLIMLGYKKDDYIQTVLNDWRWRHHHVTYYHPEKKVKLEVHWRLNPFPSKEPSFEELWERKCISSLTSYPVYSLGREDLFLFLVSHGARHGWSRLRWLVDIHQMFLQCLQWPIIIQQLKKYQFFHVGGQAIVLASELLNSPIKNEMEQLISSSLPKRLAQAAIFYLEKPVNLHTDPVPKDIAEYHKNHLFCLMSNRQKIWFVMSFLYPYPDDAETLPLPKPLHLLYFPLRPVLWAWRKTKKHAFS